EVEQGELRHVVAVLVLVDAAGRGGAAGVDQGLAEVLAPDPLGAGVGGLGALQDEGEVVLLELLDVGSEDLLRVQGRRVLAPGGDGVEDLLLLGGALEDGGQQGGVAVLGHLQPGFVAAAADRRVGDEQVGEQTQQGDQGQAEESEQDAQDDRAAFADALLGEVVHHLVGAVAEDADLAQRGGGEPGDRVGGGRRGRRPAAAARGAAGALAALLGPLAALLLGAPLRLGERRLLGGGAVLLRLVGVGPVVVGGVGGRGGVGVVRVGLLAVGVSAVGALLVVLVGDAGGGGGVAVAPAAARSPASASSRRVGSAHLGSHSSSSAPPGPPRPVRGGAGAYSSRS